MFLEKSHSRIEAAYEERLEEISFLRESVNPRVRELPEDTALAVKYLYASMPLSDIGNYGLDTYLDYAEHGVYLWENCPYVKGMPEDIFLEYVLNHRINTEEITPCRRLFYGELKGRIEGLSIEEAALEVNYWCAEKASYRATDDRTAAPRTVYRCGAGRCGEESAFTVSAMRSVGIPARQVYAPLWSHCDDNHAWVEVWCDGEWHFLGACEPEPVLNRGWFTGAASRAMMIHSRCFGARIVEMGAAGNVIGQEGAVRMRNRFAIGQEGAVQMQNWFAIGQEGAARMQNQFVIGREGIVQMQNQLARYAAVKRLFIFVKNPDGTIAPGAEIKLNVLNYAGFGSIAHLQCGADGAASVLTGLGSLLVTAHGNGLYGEALIDTRKTERAKVVLGDRKTNDSVEHINSIVVDAEEQVDKWRDSGCRVFGGTRKDSGSKVLADTWKDSDSIEPAAARKDFDSKVSADTRKDSDSIVSVAVRKEFDSIVSADTRKDSDSIVMDSDSEVPTDTQKDSGSIAPGDIWVDFDSIAPADMQVNAVQLTKLQKEERDRRLALAARIRTEKINAFVPEWRKRIAQETGEVRAVWEKLMTVLTEKDRVDVSPEVLLHHVEQALPLRGRYPEEIFVKYVLNPRVADEVLSDYREAVEGAFTGEEKALFREDPGTLWNWICAHIANSTKMEHGAVVTLPAAVLKLRAAGALSRRIFFVAAARTFGIPARLNPVDHAMEFLSPQKDACGPEAYLGQEFVAVEPEREKNGILTFTGQENVNWSYAQNWSLARLEEDGFRMLHLHDLPWTAGRLSVKLASGIYRVITANRLPNGNLFAKKRELTLRAGEDRTLELRLRDAALSDMLGENQLPPFYLLDKQGNRIQAAGLTRDGRRILIWLEAGSEPTEHILNELIEQKAEYEKHQSSLLFIVKHPEDMAVPTLTKCRQALPQVQVLYDTFTENVNTLARRMYVDPEKLPLILVMNGELNCIYASSGYNVGTADMLLRILKM